MIWDKGVLRHAGRVDMTRTALEGFGKSLQATDEVVIEATGNSTAVFRVLSPFVAAGDLYQFNRRTADRSRRLDARIQSGQTAGKTPKQTFLEAMPMTNEKMIAA